MAPSDPSTGPACCGGGEPAAACVFGKALLAQAAGCRHARRHAAGEALATMCATAAARADCAALATLLHERARFALKLPAAGRPLMHAQAMRLQCGGIAALRQLLASTADSATAADAPAGGDVHALVASAAQRFGGLDGLPWTPLVGAVAAWQPRRRIP